MAFKEKNKPMAIDCDNGCMEEKCMHEIVNDEGKKTNIRTTVRLIDGLQFGSLNDIIKVLDADKRCIVNENIVNYINGLTDRLHECMEWDL